jgi:cellulose synthase/poly-beta-1,6-N-acetylglucosamine synthase-like glycosyltransferase
MKISYAIPVCNEIEEIKRLLEFLIKTKRAQDEIVIVIDEQNGTEEVKDYVEDFAHEYLDLEDIKVLYHPLNKDFATHKNFINVNCSGDYIFSIDADEMPDKTLIKYLPEILESNDVDAIWIPRINIVNGISQQHIGKQEIYTDLEHEYSKNKTDYEWAKLAIIKLLVDDYPNDADLGAKVREFIKKK